MPTYEYECTECGHSFEELQSMMEKKLRKCPKCGKMKLQRLIGTGGGIIFKGTGFYETDFKTKTEPKKKESEGAPKAASDATAVKSDNKSDD
ncbi:MAG: FmdB family zinc ribbon protein [Candidatus Omnitrophota bacterium]